MVDLYVSKHEKSSLKLVQAVLGMCSLRTLKCSRFDQVKNALVLLFYFSITKKRNVFYMLYE